MDPRGCKPNGVENPRLEGAIAVPEGQKGQGRQESERRRSGARRGRSAEVFLAAPLDDLLGASDWHIRHCSYCRALLHGHSGVPDSASLLDFCSTLLSNLALAKIPHRTRPTLIEPAIVGPKTPNVLSTNQPASRENAPEEPKFQVQVQLPCIRASSAGMCSIARAKPGPARSANTVGIADGDSSLDDNGDDSFQSGGTNGGIRLDPEKKTLPMASYRMNPGRFFFFLSLSRSTFLAAEIHRVDRQRPTTRTREGSSEYAGKKTRW